jgi:hypothetical protein
MLYQMRVDHSLQHVEAVAKSSAPKCAIATAAQNRSRFRGDWFYLCEFQEQILDLAFLVKTGEADDFHEFIFPRPSCEWNGLFD